MLKFRGRSDDGREFLGFIVDEENLFRLRHGHPIHIFKEEMDLPFDIMIAYSKDLVATVAEMKAKGMVDDSTVVQDDHKRKRS
jgi:hypothetical protein